MIELSVIIPTRNRAEVLNKALQSIVVQTLDQNLFEVIVADNGSTDSTRQIVESYSDKIKNLIYTEVPEPGLHNGRHAGFKLAQSEILVYADDDIEAFPTWLEAILSNFAEKDVVMVGGKDLPKFESQPPFWVLKLWYKVRDAGQVMPYLSLIDLGEYTKECSPYNVFGCNFAVRKKIIDLAGGFHPDGMPWESVYLRGDGETYIARYVDEHSSMKCIYNPLASVYHFVPNSRTTLDYFQKWSFCMGIASSYEDLRYSKPTNDKVHVSWSKLLKKRVRKIINMWGGYENNRLLHQLLSLPELSDFNREMRDARKIGYDYHQYLYRTMDTVREWVHRENYF